MAAITPKVFPSLSKFNLTYSAILFTEGFRLIYEVEQLCGCRNSRAFKIRFFDIFRNDFRVTSEIEWLYEDTVERFRKREGLEKVVGKSFENFRYRKR